MEQFLDGRGYERQGGVALSDEVLVAQSLAIRLIRFCRALPPSPVIPCRPCMPRHSSPGILKQREASNPVNERVCGVCVERGVVT